MGLLTLRNRFGYPGGAAGLPQPGHVALQTTVSCNPIIFSGAATPGGFLRLDTIQAATVHGSPTNTIHGQIGPTLKCSAGTCGVSYTITDDSGVANEGLTFAAIIIPGGGSGGLLSTGTSNATNNNLRTTGTTLGVTYNNSATTIISGAFSSTTPCMVIVSSARSTAKQFATIVNLNTGQINQGSTTSAGPSTGASNNVTIGNVFDFSGSWVGQVACVAITRAYLSLDAQLVWARDPWSFWYPPTVRQIIASSLAPESSNAGTFAWTEPTDTFAFTGSDAGAGTFAWTEPTDTFAFSGSDANTGTFAWTEPTDTFAFAGVSSNTGTFAWTEPTDTFSFAGQEIDPGTMAWTEPADTFVFNGEDDIFGTFAWAEPPDSINFYQTKAPDLRQKSYKHRFLGRSFDPQVVVEKDRPGPLRIIEFDAWMD